MDVLIIAPDVPAYAHPGDAGADLTSAEAVRLEPGQRALVGTGVRIALPDGLRGIRRAPQRPGHQARHHDRQLARDGRCRLSRRDQGHTAEHRRRRTRTTSRVGDRIAQLIVMPVPRGAVHPGRDAARERARRGRIRIDRIPEQRAEQPTSERARGERPATEDQGRSPHDRRTPDAAPRAAGRRDRAPAPSTSPRRTRSAPTSTSAASRSCPARASTCASRSRSRPSASSRSASTTPARPCRCSRSPRPARPGCGKRRASRSASRSASRAAASRSARARSAPSCSPRCPSWPVRTAPRQAPRALRRRRRPALVPPRSHRRSGDRRRRGRGRGRGPVPLDRRRARRLADAAARPHPAADAGHPGRRMTRRPRRRLAPDGDAIRRAGPPQPSVLGAALGDAARRAGLDPAAEPAPATSSGGDGRVARHPRIRAARDSSSSSPARSRSTPRPDRQTCWLSLGLSVGLAAMFTIVRLVAGGRPSAAIGGLIATGAQRHSPC